MIPIVKTAGVALLLTSPALAIDLNSIHARASLSIGDTVTQVSGAFSYLLCKVTQDVYEAAAFTSGSKKAQVCTDPNLAAIASKAAKNTLTLPLAPTGVSYINEACAVGYTDTSSGAVFGPGLGTFPMNPRPTTFVTRSGSSLVLDGKPFNLVGPNIYWLGMDDNVWVPKGPDNTTNWALPTYPSKQRVREAFAIAVAMGATTVRSHTLGISTGSPISVWPTEGQTNTAAFVPIDYAIYAARNYGIRLIIPLTDNYKYFHGGKFDFIKWQGLSTNFSGPFYTNPAVVTSYKNYITAVLTHVNTNTGVALKDDPTILGWETGNELGGYELYNTAPPASWTADIAAHIKSLAPNHLIIDGSDGLTNSAGHLATHALEVPGVDIVSDHFYPASVKQLENDVVLMNGTSKYLLMGELDWTQLHGGDSLDGPTGFYNTLENLESVTPVGSMAWSVLGHDDTCCAFMKHNDGGYSMQYPNGDVTTIPRILSLVQHWHRIRGMAVPTTLPAVACPQPELLP